MIQPRIDLPAIAVEHNKSKKLRPISINTSIESEYYKFLKLLIQQTKERFINIVVEGLNTEAIKEQIQDESYASKMNRLVSEAKNKIKSQFHQKRLKDFIVMIISKADKNQKAKLFGNIQASFGIDMKQIPDFQLWKPFINSVIKKNLTLVSGLRDETIKRVEMAVRVGVEQGKSLSQVKTEIMKSKGVSERQAATIARNEIKNVTSELTRRRLISAGFTMYEWLTSEDERVRGNPSGAYPKARPRHDIMNGLICRLDDETVYSKDNGKTWLKRTSQMPLGHPGTAGINCRCRQIAFVG